MSLDRSLKSASSLVRHRNVLTRGERLLKLQDASKWDESKSPLGLVKVGNRKVVLAKIVKEVAADSFTLDLGKEEWRFYTDGSTTGKDAIKAGDKVTVTYKQVATKVESKGVAKAPAKKK